MIEFGQNYKPMVCKDILNEIAETKKIRPVISNQIVQHAVGEIVKHTKSLMLNRKITNRAAVKIVDVYPAMGAKKDIYTKLVRRLKHLRIKNEAEEAEKNQSRPNDVIFNEFFEKDSIVRRKNQILKNNRKNRLETFADKFSVFSRNDYVSFY